MSQSTVKILIVFNKLDIGGIERKIVDIANHYSTKVDVYILLKHQHGQLLRHINPQVNILSPRLSHPLFFPIWLTIQFQKIKPNLVLAFGNYSGICSSFTPSPLIISEDSSVDVQLQSDSFSRLRTILVKLLYPLATKIIVLTDTAKTKLSKITSVNNTVVLPNWLPLSTKIKPSPKPIDILFVGRFEPQKNPLLFLSICQNLPNLKITMVGGGSLKPKIINYIKKHRLNVNLVPATTDVSPFFQQSKILLLTSVHEGFPLTVLESAANKCLPVCNNLPEFLDFFDYHSDKIIFKSPTDAIKKIRFLLSNKQLLSKLSAHYQKKVVNLQSSNFTATTSLIDQFL